MSIRALLTAALLALPVAAVAQDNYPTRPIHAITTASLGVKGVDELVAYSKQKAGTLSYLAPGPPLVLYMETLKKERGADWVRVPFRGGGEAVTAILSGSTPIALFGEGNVIGNIRAG